MRIRIEGIDLPGEPWSSEASVGVQRKHDVVHVVGAHVPEVVWDVEAIGRRLPDGLVDLTGPYIHGRRGGRFLYLSWGREVHGHFEMFRRAKLMLEAVPAAVLADANAGATLVGRLSLSGADGSPVCAAVRPPAISWSADW